MGNLPGGVLEAGMDVWLRGGGLVVTASERAARALTLAYHRARRIEGLAAWAAPNIQDWHSFLRAAWQARRSDDRLVLNAVQERAVWAEIVGAGGAGSALLENSRQRLARLAMEANELLCAYAPQFLAPRARLGWQADARALSGWLAEFDEVCRSQRLLSAARLPLELLPQLAAGAGERPPLLLAGFDRILPVQRSVFNAWGEWREAQTGAPAKQIAFYLAADAQAELAACARWCQLELTSNPSARLLVVTQDVPMRRGEMERAFSRYAPQAAAAQRFEFSLGVPLSNIAPARGAMLILRWLAGALAEHEIDWLFSSGQTTAGDAELYALTGFMRALRRRSLERTEWPLEEFLAQDAGAQLPLPWAARMANARRLLQADLPRMHTALEWAELAPVLLRAAGWPGGRPLTSAEFQALRRWQQTLDTCASLGFNGRRMRWQEFLQSLGRLLDETLFAAESRDASIQIAGPAESAGLTADAIWFLGANAESWPAAGSTHPLLPLEVQRGAEMPHSSAQLDWELAHAVTARLLRSAPLVRFSSPRQSEGVEMRPSRLATQMAGAPQPLPAELRVPDACQPLTERFEDCSRVPLAVHDAAGGSTVLTSQSQCPFKAFATARLGAQGWEAAQAGLTAAQRGQLLHAVLHSIWGKAPASIHSHRELVAIADLRAFVEIHVRNVLASAMPATARAQMPQRYLVLEEERLIRVVREWLEFERTRAEFVVAGAEVKRDKLVAGLALHLRLDRLDRLNDGTVLVIDYKTGAVSTKSWELPRPEDVQLPLYAAFALDREQEPLGGLVFAKIRPGEHCFEGRVGKAAETLLPSLGARKALARHPLTAEDLMAWRDSIEQLARDFIAGRADVDPRDPLKTCERCDLQVLCRIAESGHKPNGGEEEDDDERGSEA